MLVGQVAPDVDEHAVAKRQWVHADVEQLRSQVSDHRHVDAVLDLRERVVAAGRRCLSRGGQSLVQFHQRLLEPRRSPLRASP